jgi:MauM/NapG family ferredoxin protein
MIEKIANKLRWLINFVKTPKGAEMSIKRRSLLTAGVAGVTGGLLFRSTRPAEAAGVIRPTVIRPPGSVAKADFLGQCIRCGECMKACPTNAIQPALFESGLEGLWSPVMKLRLGYCEYKCTECTQVCPTGAIGKISLKDKQVLKIGLAVVDKDRCVNYAYGKQCTMCHDQCPLPDKAIVMVTSTVQVGSRTLTIKQPQVDADLCIGCGICENKCPVDGQAAIRVVAI